MAKALFSLVGPTFAQALREVGTFAFTQGPFALAATLVPFAASSDPFALPMGVALGAFLLLSFLGIAVGSVVSDALLRGERLSLAEAWGRVGAGSLVLTVLVMTAAFTFLGVMVHEMGDAPVVLLPLAAIAWLAARWSVAIPASVAGAKGAAEALRTSHGLTRGATLPVLALLALVALLVVVPIALATFTFVATYGELSAQAGAAQGSFAGMGDLFFTWVGGVALGLLGSFVAASLTTHLHHRLRAAPVSDPTPAADPGRAASSDP